jgi:tetratricopeptide (TPR) repeat protein
MKNTNVFISFSSRDISFVREIMSGLSSQDIDFWDYSDNIYSIEAGQNIEGRLKQEIDGCDYFIPLISNNSVDKEIGRFTRMEVKYAIDIGLLNSERFIPVELNDLNSKPIVKNGPYVLIKDLLYLEFELHNISSYVNLIESICKRIGKDFIPQIEAHPKLPFWRLFRDEVLSLAHSNHSHVHLMSIIGEFNEYMKRGDWKQANFLIGYFISSCNYYIPGYQMFYPWIVKAVCEQELNLLDEAWKSYEAAKKVKLNDENVYGGFGNICMQKEDFICAEKNFALSIQYCPVHENTDERINLLTAKVSLNKAIDKKEGDFVLDLDATSFYGDAQTKILNLQQAVRFQNKNYKEIIKSYNEMVKNDQHDSTSLIYCIFSHSALGNYHEAEKCLLAAIEKSKHTGKRFDQTMLYQQLSDLYLDIGRVEEALEIYRSFLLQPDRITRPTFIKYARIQRYLKNFDETKRACEQMLLGGKTFPLPISEEDYYFDGFVWFLLGNNERAQYDYERSNSFDIFYEQHEY